MAKSISLNDARPTYLSIVNHRAAVKLALDVHFSPHNPDHIGLTQKELEDLKRSETEHQEKQDILSLLSFLEACFRIDYISRKRQNLKDSLSKALIRIFNRKIYRASLDDDILRTWYKLGMIQARMNSDLHQAFNFRNWLAHGQYWEISSSKKNDFYQISLLIEGLINSDSFESKGV